MSGLDNGGFERAANVAEETHMRKKAHSYRILLSEADGPLAGSAGVIIGFTLAVPSLDTVSHHARRSSILYGSTSEL